MQIAGNLIIGIGLIITLIGIYGTFRFREFYTRILISSKIDTMGFITILIGILMKSGFSIFTVKVLLILIISFITTPLPILSSPKSLIFKAFL